MKEYTLEEFQNELRLGIPDLHSNKDNTNGDILSTSLPSTKRTSVLKLCMLCIIMLLPMTKDAISQVKVYADGRLEVYSQVGAWEKALKTIVTSPYACAYHLNYNNEDVSYFCAQGWLWTKMGGYFGSDVKYKQGILNISSPLSIIQTMQGRQYYFKDDSTRLRYGFIGQELEKAHPEMVKKMDDGSLAVSYMDVIAILVECVKEQQEEIDALKKEIERMANK